VEVRLYDIEANRELLEMDVDEDAEDEDGNKKSENEKFTEIVKAGGANIKYLAKRPAAAETFQEGGGWEVMARLTFEHEGKGIEEDSWERAVVVDYKPLDETVKLKFFDDGDMTDYFSDLAKAKMKSHDEYSEIVDLGGSDIRYLHCRPKLGSEEAVGWLVNGFVGVGESEDAEGVEETDYDWVKGRISCVRGSQDNEEEQVYIIVSDDKGSQGNGGTVSESESRASGEEMREYECAMDNLLEIQFLEYLGGVPELIGGKEV